MNQVATTALTFHFGSAPPATLSVEERQYRRAYVVHCRICVAYLLANMAETSAVAQPFPPTKSWPSPGVQGQSATHRPRHKNVTRPVGDLSTKNRPWKRDSYPPSCESVNQRQALIWHHFLQTNPRRVPPLNPLGMDGAQVYKVSQPLTETRANPRQIGDYSTQNQALRSIYNYNPKNP